MSPKVPSFKAEPLQTSTLEQDVAATPVTSHRGRSGPRAERLPTERGATAGYSGARGGSAWGGSSRDAPAQGDSSRGAPAKGDSARVSSARSDSTRGATARRSTAWRLAGLAALIVVVVVAAFLSVTMGARSITLDTIASAFTAFDPESTAHVVIRDLRVPRTVLGLVVGASLGLAGALMQGVTRNALADPGILGVNAGASLFVVVGISAFGMSSLSSYAWLAMAGAAVATAIVYGIASVGRDGANPIKLALAGAAVTAALYSGNTGILLVDASTLQEFRFWQVGSLAGRHLDIVMQVLPFLAVGVALALITGRALNGLSLGDDAAKALGQRVLLTRVTAGIAIVILCGAATAAVGPIAFVGLVIPHIARAIVGPDYRWILAYSVVIGAILLVGADVLGRVVAAPGELQVGVVTAALGAPVFIALIRRRKLAVL